MKVRTELLTISNKYFTCHI